MSACAHRLWDDPNGLRCTRPAHDDRGHVYATGSDVDDKHKDGGHG